METKNEFDETYNSSHFDEAKNRRLLTQIGEIEQRQKLILEYMIEFLSNADFSNQMKHCDIYLKLLSKIRFTFESINVLLPFLKEDYRYKVSLNLLYRGVVDDLINMYYLIAFYSPTDKDQRSLDAELNVLHREFLRALEEIHDAEIKFIKLLGADVNDKEGLDEWTEKIKSENPELYDGDRMKHNNEIRSNSLLYNDSVFFKRTGTGSFISERKKLDFIPEIGGRSMDSLKILFKHFSQFHHFTPKTYDLQNTAIEYDLQCYQYVAIELTFVLATLSRFIVFTDKEYALSLFSDYEQALGIQQD